MTTEYRIHLDREACDGVFACLVRDDRFVEAPDGLATIDDGRDHRDDRVGDGEVESAEAGDGTDTLVVAFDDGRLAAASEAARACPLDAIDVVRRAGRDDDE